MNVIFFAMMLVAFATAAVRELAWHAPTPDAAGPMQTLAAGMIKAAGDSVTLAIGLVGVMTLFLGLMKVAEQGGLLTIIARTIRPLMVRAFPGVPADHPAMGAMIMNLSANALGLGNAATPFGIRAMQQLDRLNPYKGTASDAMVLFLAINTSSVTLLPTGVIALRAAAGSHDPAGILPTTLFATICSTSVAVLAAFAYRRFAPFGRPETAAPAALEDAPDTAEAGFAETEPGDATAAATDLAESAAYPGWVTALAFAAIFAFVPVTILYGRAISPWIVPGLAVGLLGFGVARRVRVYEAFVDGARDGFQVAIRIIPYLVAILVAVAMLRELGALEIAVSALGKVTGPLGLPAEALPMALLRPLSGSGAYGVLASIINDPAIGPDSYTGYLVSTFQGSTETTFYVLAVYFGAVGIRRVRHALATALTADLAGIIAAVVICSLLYG